MKTLIEGFKLQRLLKELSNAPAGDVVEFGVYQGGSLAAMAKAAPDRRMYGFDTFEGMPEALWRDGEPHGVGDFGDTSYEAVARKMPENVTLVRGTFPNSAGDLSPDIALAHLDFDWYESTKAALEWVLPKLVPGGVIVFDDYEWKHCPGVRRAIDEAGLTVTHKHNQAIYRVAP